MYKHQVVGIRRENSWRSRESEHIVGMCTLEAVDGSGRFENFDPNEEWRAIDGKVRVEPDGGNHHGLSAVCRYWSLEEALEAMRRSTPRHEFYTREPKRGRRKIPAYGYLGSATDLFTRDPAGNEIPVYCDENEGWLYTKAGGRRVRLRRSHPLFVGNPRTRESQEVKRKAGALMVLDPDGNETETECRAGDVRWVTTQGNNRTSDNLHAMKETPVVCPQAHCTVIPRASRPVSRGHGSDL